MRELRKKLTNGWKPKVDETGQEMRRASGVSSAGQSHTKKIREVSCSTFCTPLRFYELHCLSDSLVSLSPVICLAASGRSSNAPDAPESLQPYSQRRFAENYECSVFAWQSTPHRRLLGPGSRIHGSGVWSECSYPCLPSSSLCKLGRERGRDSRDVSAISSCTMGIRLQSCRAGWRH